MLTQLQELKVLDTALMQSGGYPVRPAYNQFLRSYQVLLSSQQPLQEQLSPRDRCERILQEAGLKDYTLGQSSVSPSTLLFLTPLLKYVLGTRRIKHVTVVGVSMLSGC